MKLGKVALQVWKLPNCPVKNISMYYRLFGQWSQHGQKSLIEILLSVNIPIPLAENSQCMSEVKVKVCL